MYTLHHPICSNNTINNNHESHKTFTVHTVYIQMCSRCWWLNAIISYFKFGNLIGCLVTWLSTACRLINCYDYRGVECERCVCVWPSVERMRCARVCLFIFLSRSMHSTPRQFVADNRSLHICSRGIWKNRSMSMGTVENYSSYLLWLLSCVWFALALIDRRKPFP